MYEVVKLFDDEVLEEFLYLYENDLLRVTPAKLYSSKGDIVSLDIRKTDVAWINYKWYPEINEPLEEHVNDGSRVNQYNYLIYNQGDYFLKHNDILPDLKRKWTTVTLLDKSDDLVGGNLLLWSEEDGDPITIDLKVGETAIFRSHLLHEATEVIQGWRKVLVAWMI